MEPRLMPISELTPTLLIIFSLAAVVIAAAALCGFFYCRQHMWRQSLDLIEKKAELDFKRQGLRADQLMAKIGVATIEAMEQPEAKAKQGEVSEERPPWEPGWQHPIAWFDARLSGAYWDQNWKRARPPRSRLTPPDGGVPQ